MRPTKLALLAVYCLSAPAPAALAPTPGRDAVIGPGTLLSVRLNHAVTTESMRPGDRFTAVLVEPVNAGNAVAIPKGAGVSGVVRNAASSGRLKGRAVLTLAVDRIEWQGRTYSVQTAELTRVSSRHKKRNWTLIGGGSGVGALVGGIATGGTGALIGAGAGAAAGAVGAAVTGRKHVRIPAESLLTFRLRAQLTVHMADQNGRR